MHPLRSSIGRDGPSQPDVHITSHHHQEQPWSSQRAGPALISGNQEFAAGFGQSWVKPGTVTTLVYFTLKAQLMTLSNDKTMHMGFTVLKT